MVMKITLLTFTSIYLLAVLYLTRNAWLDPEAFLEFNRRKRSRFSAVWSIFPYNIVARFLDGHPKSELWSSRIAILLMYLTLGFGLVLILTDSLR
jgi:hypothetical protein